MIIVGKFFTTFGVGEKLVCQLHIFEDHQQARLPSKD